MSYPKEPKKQVLLQIKNFHKNYPKKITSKHKILQPSTTILQDSATNLRVPENWYHAKPEEEDIFYNTRDAYMPESDQEADMKQVKYDDDWLPNDIKFEIQKF